MNEPDSAAPNQTRPFQSPAFIRGKWLEVLQERLVAAGLTAADAERRALLVLAAIEGALILARARCDPRPLSAVREELVALTR